MAILNSKTGKTRKKYSTDDLKKAANLMRGYNLVSLAAAGSGHSGGTLSIMDITAALYLHVADHDPKNPDWILATGETVETEGWVEGAGGGPVVLQQVVQGAGRGRPGAQGEDRSSPRPLPHHRTAGDRANANPPAARRTEQGHGFDLGCHDLAVNDLEDLKEDINKYHPIG